MMVIKYEKRNICVKHVGFHSKILPEQKGKGLRDRLYTECNHKQFLESELKNRMHVTFNFYFPL